MHIILLICCILGEFNISMISLTRISFDYELLVRPCKAMESHGILQAHNSADKTPSISLSYKNKGSSNLNDYTFTKNRLFLEK